MKKIPAFVLLLLFALAAAAQTLSVRDIMREPSLAGLRPDGERLSPDGRFVVFAWNPQGKEPRHLYLISTSGGGARLLVDAEANFEPRAAGPESKLNYGLTVRDDFAKAREKNLGGVDISPDSRRLLFTQNTDIYVLELNEQAAKPRRVTRTAGFEAGARWLTDDAILYSSGGNWFVLNLDETALVQVTREANPPAFVSVFNATPSKDGKLLAYVTSDGSRQRALFVPNYLDEFVTAPTFRRGWTEQKVFVAPTDGSRERPFEVKLPKAEGNGYVRGLRWAADHRSLVVDRLDQDLKRRQIFYVAEVGGKAEQTILLTEERDEKWIAPLSRFIEPHPTDAAQILFASERDGHNHLYLATLPRLSRELDPNAPPRQENPTAAPFSTSVKTEQMTRGAWEIDWAKWSSDKVVVFSSTQASTAEREFYHLFPATKTVQLLATGDKGMKTGPQIAEPGGATTRFVYNFSRWNRPTELFAGESCNAKCENAPPVRLTDSTPAAFKQIKWSEPRFVDIPTRDGKAVKSKVYFPPNFDAKRKYPLVVFVHGAGYLQNTINGWNNYYREFMFNHILTEKGYVVLDIDYRGSAGYGRDWRTDVFDFLGGKDYEDHLDAIDFAVKNYAVDANKVGVYGGSYGGFMAGMLVLRAPEKIAAAAALRPVFDWKNYYAANPTYTAERLGYPERNPEAYRRSSPIAYAENLQKPLLILHGMLDDNVHVQDSVQMIEKLMRLEKTRHFEAMLYPAENHAFTRPTSWADEYERILWFFEKHLK